jgi:uncharacterized membrane protein (DUF106 family)
MLSFVPDSFLLLIVNGILVAGAVLTFLSFFVINRILRFFPPLANYHTLLQVISVAILAAGVYFKGSYQTEIEWREKVAEWKAKAEEFQAKADRAKKEGEDLNKRLEEERKKKQKVRVEYYNTIKTELKEVEVEKVINAECKVDPKANEILNKAAKNPSRDKK